MSTSAKLSLPSTSLVWTFCQGALLNCQCLDPEKRSLHPDVFQNLSQSWEKPDVEILTSRFNNKLNRFVARTRNLLALAVDAVVIPWTLFRLIYAFPAVRILTHKTKVERTLVILFPLNWSRRTRYANILLVDKPWPLPNRRKVLFSIYFWL